MVSRCGGCAIPEPQEASFAPAPWGNLGAMSGRSVGRRLLTGGALVAAVAGLLAAWADSTPVANLGETRPFALGAALVALVLVFARWRLGPRGLAAPIALGLAVVALGWSVWLLRFAYRSEPLAFQNGDVRLSGTLFSPRRSGRYPAVVYLHGSGRETRKEFYYQAKLFARHGIAALAWDKRGSGASSGEAWAPYAAYAADAAAGARRLAGLPEVDPGRIGFYGASEGGWVAVLAAQRVHPAFVIVASATPLTPAEQVLYQTGEDVRRAGFNPEAVGAALALQRRVLDFQRSSEAPERAQDLAKDLEAAAREPWFPRAKLPRKLWPPEEYAWWRSVMDFDPRPGWRAIRCPVLALGGGRDDRSDARASLDGIAREVAAGSGAPVTTVLFPAADHPLLEWPFGDHVPPPRWPDGYARTLVCWTRLQTGEPATSFCRGWRAPQGPRRGDPGGRGSRPRHRRGRRGGARVPRHLQHLAAASGPLSRFRLPSPAHARRVGRLVQRPDPLSAGRRSSP